MGGWVGGWVGGQVYQEGRRRYARITFIRHTRGGGGRGSAPPSSGYALGWGKGVSTTFIRHTWEWGRGVSTAFIRQNAWGWEKGVSIRTIFIRCERGGIVQIAGS